MLNISQQFCQLLKNWSETENLEPRSPVLTQAGVIETPEGVSVTSWKVLPSSKMFEWIIKRDESMNESRTSDFEKSCGLFVSVLWILSHSTSSNL